MLKLLKYTKPYLLLLALSIILLFAQANIDLALPDYLSGIVNTGIQQGGIENAIPIVIRQSEMNRVLMFIEPDQKDSILADYTLVDHNSVDFQQNLEKYPILANEPVFILNNINQTEISRIDPIIGKALMAVASIEGIMADPSKAAQMGPGLGGFDLSKLPAGTDLFALLAKLPASNLTQITDKLNQKIEVLGNKIINQAAVLEVKKEYQAVGLDTGKYQNNYILKAGAWMLLLTLISGTIAIIVGYLASRIAAGMARDIRRDVFSKVESFASTEFDKFSTASLITRNTNDITQIQMVVIMMVRMVFYAPLIGIGGIIKVLSKDSPLAWLILIAVLMLVSLILTIFSVALPKFRLNQKLVDRINLVSRENLTGMMVIRSFNKQKFEEERFDNANVDVTAVSLFINRLMVMMFPIMMLIMNTLMLGIVWFGAKQVAAANMQVGDMIAYMQYAMQIVMSFVMLSMMFIIIPRASVSGDRIAEVIDTDPHIKDIENPESFPSVFKGDVEFRDVSFRYPGADTNALENINFTARSGQTTAFIGSTGAGKSTIVNLIPRLYDVTEGVILIDSVDIRKVTQHDLRAKIGYVPQKSSLFSGTIKSNLLYADKNATDEMLYTAIDIAQAEEFIKSTDAGLDTEISQGGANVSGGQKQRLSIARAIVKRPPIYILDDSFSALDFKTDSALRRAFKEKSSESTLLIVTQRVSTIKNAEQIIVLDDGHIVGKGTHKELLENCETYREIATSQLNKEELL